MITRSRNSLTRPEVPTLPMSLVGATRFPKIVGHMDPSDIQYVLPASSTNDMTSVRFEGRTYETATPREDVIRLMKDAGAEIFPAVTEQGKIDVNAGEVTRVKRTVRGLLGLKEKAIIVFDAAHRIFAHESFGPLDKKVRRGQEREEAKPGRNHRKMPIAPIPGPGRTSRPT